MVIEEGMISILYKFLNKKKFIFGIFLSLFGAGLSLFLPQIIGQLMDAKFITSILEHHPLLIGIMSLFVVSYLVQAISMYLIGSSGSEAMNKVQKYIFDKMVKLPIHELDSYQSGDLASRLTNDMTAILKLITSTLPQFLLNILMIVGAIYFLLRINLHMTLVCLLLVPIMTLIIIPINRRLEQDYERHQNYIGEISGQASHKLNHVRTIKAFKGETQETTSLGRVFDNLFSNFKKILTLSAFQGALLNSIVMGFIIFMLVIASLSVSQGSMTIATLTTFILYMMKLIEPISGISESISDISEIKGVSRRIVQIMKEKEETGIESEALPVLPLVESSSIQFKDVSFAYEVENVLNHLSFHVKAGQHMAVVGASGAGKSTIFSLLLKFYTQYQGEILVDGKEIGHISPSAIRRIISYIPQDNTLFRGSIRDNLLYGKNKTTSEKRLKEVLETLHLTGLVQQLEKGLDTMITDSGAGLSEGQKQRFNIARAFMQPSSIYLLDEVTASLDSDTEKIINRAINELTVGRTRITIAHRLHTVKNADVILVLDKNGQVEDMGSHGELLIRNDLYRNYLEEFNK